MAARDPLAIVRDYHGQTKHHFNRFARSLGYLDWATQPAPFRLFSGCRRVDLVAPLHAAGQSTNGGASSWRELDYDSLFGPVTDRPSLSPGLPAVSVFLRYSLGLSAWKQAGPSRWALRVNPSSGNLHPTEGYIICGPGIAGDRPGVYHYAPDAHALEERCTFDPDAWRAAIANAPAGSFLAALTSIHWREAWKYGERAFRYCQHDLGHAVAAMRMAAAMIGWTCEVLPDWTAGSTAALVGAERPADFEGVEPEEPACVMLVAPGRGGAPGSCPSAVRHAGVEASLAAAVARGAWSGRASRLSSDRVQWDWIDAVAEASRAGAILRRSRAVAPPVAPAPRRATQVSAARLLLQRRSAVSMDGATTMGLDRFAALLRRLMPQAGPPFDAFPWTPRIHLALFVHRVDRLQPGIYALPRTGAGEALMRSSLSGDFAWLRPPGVPDDVPLYLLSHSDCRRIARQLSCGQDIAADGCFCLGMLAEFDAALAEGGPAAYRRMFWEAGAVGQALYLEAEAAGVRGTGIGCFFDDGVHDLLGLAAGAGARAHGECEPPGARADAMPFQSLYHFTVGGPVEDNRLTTQPGYPWESR